MKWSQIIYEGRDAPLYHFMDTLKAINVFITDTMPANWTHQIPTDPDRAVKGNSFTRDQAMQWGGSTMAIKLTVDQPRLAQSYRIIPVDGHIVYGHTRNTFDQKNWKSDRSSRAEAAFKPNPSEEFVVGDIKRLHRYITHIEFVHFFRDERDAILFDVVQAYGQKWQLPVKLDPSVMAGFADYKNWLKNDSRFPQTHTMNPDIHKYFPDYQPAASR